MSIYNQASLIMYPSGYKNSKVYSLKPTDGTGDLTFTRASTATRVNSSGLIEDVASNVPRIDYSGGGCGKLLLEPQRTNLLTRSQDFSHSIWTTDANFASVISDATTSKWGTSNADKIVADSGGTSHYIRHTNIAVTADIYTLSIYAKAGEWNSIKISGTNFWATPNPSGEFNLENGTVESEINANAFIENVGDGWYKCIVVATTTPTAGGNAKYQIDIGNDNNFSLGGDDTSGLYVIDAQIEKGEYVTSVIPTSGAAVTRVTDNATNTALKSSGILSPTGNTFFFDINLIDSPADINSPHFGFYDGSFNNVVFLYNPSVGNPYVVGRLAGSGLSGGAGNTEILSNTRNKIAVRWNASGFTMYLNGVSVYTATSAYNNTIDRFRFWSQVLQPFDLNGLGIYSGNLTNDDLERLTTL